MKFPNLVIVKASAGSGKTYFLTKAFVEYLLSEKIKHRDLKNILAITFSNNAAIEIKERVIRWLKDIYFGKDYALNEFRHLANSKEELQAKAMELLDRILSNYSEFQVRTIDSFITKIFKAEAPKFGYAGDFEIIMNPRNFLKRAFDVFLSRFSESSEDTLTIMESLHLIEDNLKSDSSYIWSPSKKLFSVIENLHFLLSKKIEFVENEFIEKIDRHKKAFENAKLALKKKARDFYTTIERVGKRESLNNALKTTIEGIIADNFTAVFGKKFEKISMDEPEIKRLWEELKIKVADYVTYYSLTYYFPYLKVFTSFSETLKILKLREDKVFIDDVNRIITEEIERLSVPEIYIKLGERIYHYLIDEFQDTSPVQWRNLKMLIENSLSEGGSLLIVGDTKQAIYGFRGADYSIMAGLISEELRPQEFKSVERYEIQELNTNYRSGEVIINFVKHFYTEEFKNYLINKKESDKLEAERFHIGDDGIPVVLRLSGLYQCEQKVKDDLRGVGFVKIVTVDYDEEERDEAGKKAVLETLGKIREIHKFSYGDIAILAFKNETIKNISTWLNEERIELISLSSLDIRNRKIISELIHLLTFLDSPLDDFSFSTFILGDIAQKNFTKKHENWKRELEKFLISLNERKTKSFALKPYYKEFEITFPNLWNEFFSEPMKKVGFLPLYDLVCEIYIRFNLFNLFPEEEGALVKFLEIISQFSEGGLKEFIEFYSTSGDEDEAFWDTSKPFGKNAVTLMTIHKAKGLEFPAVILVTDMEKKMGSKDNIVLFDGDLYRFPDEETLKNPHLSFLKEIKNIHFSKNFAEELNKLYVGLTRAKELLYILVLCKKSKKEPCPRENHAVKCLSGIKKEYGSAHYIRNISSESIDVRPISTNVEHKVKKIIEWRHSQDELHDIDEIRKGEIIHNLLSEIIFIEDERLTEKLEKKAEKLLLGKKFHADKGEIIAEVMKVLKNRDLFEFFKPRQERLIYTEKEIVDFGGNLLRVDRLIIDKDKVTVIDFKFGKKAEQDEASIQIKHYMRVLGELFPEREVQGFVYFSYKDYLWRV